MAAWRSAIAGFGAAVLLFTEACSSGPRLQEASLDRIQEYWVLYKRNAPEWPEAREKWLAMGDLETRALVNLLIGEVRDRSVKPRLDEAGNPLPAWTRPVEELQRIGRPALGPLLEALQRTRDETVVYPCIAALALVADLDDLDKAFASAKDGQAGAFFRCRIVRTLARIKDPAAATRIFQALSGSYDWSIRATAADALGEYRGPLLADAIKALRSAAGDEDSFVASKASESLDKLEARMRQ